MLLKILQYMRVHTVKIQCKQLRGCPIPLLNPNIRPKPMSLRKHPLALQVYIPDDPHQINRDP